MRLIPDPDKEVTDFIDSVDDRIGHYLRELCEDRKQIKILELCRKAANQSKILHINTKQRK